MSSSSEEESERLRESLDPTFFPNDIYNSSKMRLCLMHLR